MRCFLILLLLSFANCWWIFCYIRLKQNEWSRPYYISWSLTYHYFIFINGKDCIVSLLSSKQQKNCKQLMVVSVKYLFINCLVIGYNLKLKCFSGINPLKSNHFRLRHNQVIILESILFTFDGSKLFESLVPLARRNLL